MFYCKQGFPGERGGDGGPGAKGDAVSCHILTYGLR